MENSSTTYTSWRGAFWAVGESFKLIKNDSQFFIVFATVYAIANLISYLIQGNSVYYSDSRAVYEDVILLVFLLALPRYSLALADNKKLNFKQLFAPHVGQYVAMVVSIIAYIFIAGFSLLLLIVPVIWTAAWYYFFTYPIVDKNMNPSQALGESKRIARNHKGKVWALIGVGVLMSIVLASATLIPLVSGVASAISYTVMMVAGALLYRWLQASSLAGRSA